MTFFIYLLIGVPFGLVIAALVMKDVEENGRSSEDPIGEGIMVGGVAALFWPVALFGGIAYIIKETTLIKQLHKKLEEE